MKAIVQNYKTGELLVQDAPLPALIASGLLVRNSYSLISTGTERSKIELARSNLLDKARQRPDQVRQVLNNLRQEGLIPTYHKVMTRLNSLITLGYCSAGMVIEVGEGAQEFQIGDRVACAGEGYACHAEVVYVPRNLCVKVPDAVSFDHAAFAPLGAVALQGVRQARAAVGENVAVIGLGLVGLLTVQLLKAAGCRVLGMDLNPDRCRLAQQLGADATADSGRRTADLAVEMTVGHGVDAVIITAATKSSAPIELAGRLCREKGRIVVVGAVPVNVPRKEFYEKELDVCISRAFGPGTYDKRFVEQGVDYPYGYVRWTAQRNMEAFLNLVAEGKIALDPLITHRFPIDEAPKAYDLLHNPQGRVLGILFEYDTSADCRPPTAVVWLTDTDNVQRSACERVTVGFIGAGNFAQAYLLPNFRRLDGVTLRGVATATSVSATNASRKFGFGYCTCNYHEILNDPEINCVVIATRHNLHAPLTAEALHRGKHVFVEKPLALNVKQLQQVIEAYREAMVLVGPEGETGREGDKEIHSLTPSPPLLGVGFNRRFSPFIQELKKFLVHRTGPLVMTYRVNAGYVPPDHWVHDPVEGGGRILGEVCHFVDLLQHLAGARACRVFAQTTHTHNGYIPDQDNVQVTISFTNGSTGIITYTAAGDLSFPRERLEVFADGSVAVVDNFREAVFTRRGRRKGMRRWSQEMGHRYEVEAFVEAVRQGEPAPIPFDEIVLTTLTTLQILESLRSGLPVEIDLSQILPRSQPTDKLDGSAPVRE